MSNPEDYKEIYMPEREFDKLRTDLYFARILTLARVSNAILFCFNAYIDYIDDESPSGLRQRFNASFFLAGILHEGLKVADNIEKHFGDRESFKKGFGKFLNEEETKKFRENELKTARDKFIFHYDKDVATKVLKILDFTEYKFATAVGSRSGDFYYNLADEIAFNYLIKDAKSREDEEKLFKSYYSLLSTMASKFTQSADEIILDVLLETGWKVAVSLHIVLFQ
jgi:hypothetical protein